MKAAVCTKYGPPEVLKVTEIDKPIPKEGEVCVKIYATSVTTGDVVLRGLTLPKLIFIWPIARFIHKIKKLRKKILGHEFSGVVESLGNGVTKFKKGDKVFGSTGVNGGGYAEYICVREDGILLKKPENYSFEEAAVVPNGGMVAIFNLKKLGIQKGQKILIIGASGSVGSYGVQIAKAAEAKITGVCGPEHMQLVKSLGATNVIDYTKEDFTQRNEKYDLIFDAVGKSSYKKCKSVLTQDGEFSSTNSPIKESLDDLEYLKELLEAGKVKPVIDRLFTLKEIIEAHKYVEKGKKAGNVVIKVFNE